MFILNKSEGTAIQWVKWSMDIALHTQLWSMNEISCMTNTLMDRALHSFTFKSFISRMYSMHCPTKLTCRFLLNNATTIRNNKRWEYEHKVNGSVEYNKYFSISLIQEGTICSAIFAHLSWRGDWVQMFKLCSISNSKLESGSSS
jgi:hypothetical protein